MLKYIFTLIIAITIIFFSLQKRELDTKSITLGLSLPTSGIMKAVGTDVYHGANAYFLHANETNMLQDIKIELLVYDDKYEPELTLENTKKLIDKNIFAFFGVVGTPTVKNILPTLRASEIPLIAPFSGASFLRNNKEIDIVNFRNSYKQEIDHVVEYLLHRKNISRFAVFYQNDDYGEEGYVALLHSLKEKNLVLAGEGTYKRNTLSIRHAFHEIKGATPEAVFMIGAYKANALFIKTAREDPLFKNTIFCNISFGDADEMLRELDYQTHNLFFSQVVPSYKDTTIPAVVEYRELMKKYYPEENLSFISLEIFLAAKSVVGALQNIDGAITRKKFLTEIKKLPKDFLEGMNIEYKNNQLHNKVYLFKYENNNFVEVCHED